MIDQLDLGSSKLDRLRKLSLLLKEGQITMAGNKKLKIYGTLSCKSGKRMLDKNRVFFDSEQEAMNLGYRPCGHCMRKKYLVRKSLFDSQTTP